MTDDDEAREQVRKKYTEQMKEQDRTFDQIRAEVSPEGIEEKVADLNAVFGEGSAVTVMVQVFTSMLQEVLHLCQEKATRTEEATAKIIGMMDVASAWPGNMLYSAGLFSLSAYYGDMVRTYLMFQGINPDKHVFTFDAEGEAAKEMVGRIMTAAINNRPNDVFAYIQAAKDEEVLHDAMLQLLAQIAVSFENGKPALVPTAFEDVRIPDSPEEWA